MLNAVGRGRLRLAACFTFSMRWIKRFNEQMLVYELVDTSGGRLVLVEALPRFTGSSTTWTLRKRCNSSSTRRHNWLQTMCSHSLPRTAEHFAANCAADCTGRLHGCLHRCASTRTRTSIFTGSPSSTRPQQLLSS